MNILQEAESLVYGDREKDYGSPLKDFKRIAQIWGAILDCEVSPEQVGLCMVGVKISRQCNKSKRDNLVDGAGYFATIEKLENDRPILSDGALQFLKDTGKMDQLQKTA